MNRTDGGKRVQLNGYKIQSDHQSDVDAEIMPKSFLKPLSSWHQIEIPANRSGWGWVVDLTDQMTRTISKIQYTM